ncbi:MAG: phosphotransferase family protein [Haliea sp.]|uniref:phosphotransferase family protein n=1 Tax=Haliea sp. TaxID=1932666 RepID=UPI0032EAFBDC
MSGSTHDLPPGLLVWLETLGKGSISRLERHVARREAWVVDIAREDGSVLEAFLRLDRQPVAGGNVSLQREAGICRALMATAIPVPALLGWNEEHHAALFSRVPGSADLPGVADKTQQRQVMEDFIDVIARLHRLEPDALGLDDLLGPPPRTAAEAALGDLDAQLQQFASFLADYEDPLLSYGADWLRRFAPQSVARVSLVQGDTGPVNFMFAGNRVTAVVDWEWGHWGDPMEDLGNICVREFWNPSGGLQGLFRRYEEQSGIPYTRAAAQYYRIQQNVRGMIPIHAACAQPGLRESMAWYLCYRYIGDRSTCEALADAMGIALERPDMPEPDNNKGSVLLRAAANSLQRDVLPDLQTPFACSRLRDAQVLIDCAEREHRYGNAIRADNAAEIATLLGQQPKDYAHATTRLLEAMRDRRIADEPLLQYLARKAFRDEWLYQPAASLYPARNWSALD